MEEINQISNKPLTVVSNDEQRDFQQSQDVQQSLISPIISSERNRTTTSISSIPTTPTTPLPPPPPPFSPIDNNRLIQIPKFEIKQITLEGEEDPRNWSSSRKWGTTAIISLMGFISPLGSSVVVPGSNLIDRYFQLGSREISLLPVSLFVLGLGIGPFLLAPASELKGRQPIFLISSYIFILFNIGCSVTNNYGLLCFLRFIAGAAGSTGPSLGAGSIGDMFAPRERGRAQSLYGLGPLLGPVCGAIAGGWLVQSIRSWKWLLWFLTILSAVIALIVTIFLRETYAPVLLRKKIQRLAKEHLKSLENIHPIEIQQVEELERHRKAVERIAEIESTQIQSTLDNEKDKKTFFKTVSIIIKKTFKLFIPSPELRKRTRLAMTRPFRLLFGNPICAIFSLYMGFIYGIIFLFITQHPLLFQRRDPIDNPDDPSPARLPTYGWSAGVASLTYLGLGLGFLVAASINVLLQDSIYARLVLNHGKLSWILFRDRQTIAIKARQRLLEDQKKSIEDDLERQSTVQQNQQDEGEKSGTNENTKDTSLTSSTNQQASQRNVAINTTSMNNATQTKQIINSTPPTPPPKGRPEYRLPLCLLGMIILPCGLFVFGWTATARTHFMFPLLGSFLVGVGSILPFQAILVYLVDTFIPFSASATACAVLVRCLFAAAFPLFSEKMFISLGFGWGSTVMALISCLAIPVPIVLFWKGEKLREKFKFKG